jgi:hypothetical protein
MKSFVRESKMFDPGTSLLLFLLSSPGFFYPQLGLFLPPFLEACTHALLYSLYQMPSRSIEWGELSNTAQMWEYFLWFLPLGAIIVTWMGRMPSSPAPRLSLPRVINTTLERAGYIRS